MKDKKYKIRPQVLIIAGVIVAVLIIAVIAGNIISARNKSKDNTVGMTLTQKNLRPQDAAANSKSTEEKENLPNSLYRLWRMMKIMKRRKR